MSKRLRFLALLVAVAAVGCSNRRPVDGAQPGPRLAGAVELGAVPADTELDLVIGVRLRDPIKLGRFLDAQPFTGDAMSAPDFADGFAISAAGYARLVTWLRGAGLAIVRTTDGRTSVTVRGTADVIARVFGAELRQFEDGDGRFIASVTALTLSPDVAPSVSGVVGAEGGLPWRSHMLAPGAVPQAAGGSFGATDLETQYNTSAIAKPGDGETVVILGAGNAPVMSDIAGYYSTYKPYGLAAAPAQYKVDLVGGANRDGNDIAELERQENTLDIDMVSAIAPYANVEHVLAATNTPGLFADGISYIVNNLKSAHAVTVSYGTCERGAAGYMPVVHAMLAQAKAQGQTWFFASGDTGSDACRAGATNKILSAGWPASAPFAVGVGGTQINSGTTEVVWNSYPGNILVPGGGGGGGVSESLDKPAFQMGVTPNDGARDEPDVASLAGAPYINIYIAGASPLGNTTPTGGTSAAAPVWAGVWALLEQAKNHAAITNSLEGLYTVGKAGKGFHDVTSGNLGGPADTGTGGYAAGPGYDLATGWGSPNAADLIASWQ
ncbi:MAG TPA: S53 family peptidase [Polyangia bacterium]